MDPTARYFNQLYAVLKRALRPNERGRLGLFIAEHPSHSRGVERHRFLDTAAGIYCVSAVDLL